MNITARDPLYCYQRSESTNTSIAWLRTINGTTYAFTMDIYPDGTRVYYVDAFTADRWGELHAITASPS